MTKKQICLKYLKEHSNHLKNFEIAKLIKQDEVPEFLNTSEESVRKYVSRWRSETDQPLKMEKDDTSQPIETIDETQNTQTISKKTTKQIKTLEDLIKECKIDIKVWDIKRWVCNKWEMGYKDALQKAQAIPLFQIKVWLERNKNRQHLYETKEDIIKEIKQYKPNYKKITYPKNNKYLYEICPFDVHFGKLTWGEETNFDYDIKIAEEALLKCIQEHIDNAINHKVERFLFPVGNDFFNSDNKGNTTSAGTPQDEDTRWRKTYKRGRQLIVKCIDMLRETAPVDVLVIPGNHDEERSFYLGDSLECWYNKVPGVSVNNSPKARKYYRYGVNLIGFTHGKDEKLADLPTLMAIEEGKDFGECKFREWHTADKHHNKKIDTISIDEKRGVVIRILRSISPADVWHFKKGYVGSLRAVDGFLWDRENGWKAQYTTTV